VDAQSKFDKHFYVIAHRLGHYNLYKVRFDPRNPGSVRGSNNPTPQMPRGPQATVEMIDEAPRFKYWDDAPPQDRDITAEEFEREAERRALKEYHRSQAA
jgi:hypothetical protein